MPISLTIDLEDSTERYDADGRYVVLARRILDMCDEIGCRATFFVIGRVAEAAPGLLKDIAAKEHEVAYHSHAHVSLTEERPERFHRESREDKDRFEQITGKPVAGFRAPRFSLTPQSRWAVDVLGELGFKYSSSIMPTDVSLFGFPGAPQTVFTWPNGVVEFPLPVAGLGSMRVPYLGGIYLYALPFWVTRQWLRNADDDEILWTYTHPYDFDREEPYTSMPHTPTWVSMVLWLARRVAEKKIRKVLAGGAGLPLGERLPKPQPPVWLVQP